MPSTSDELKIFLRTYSDLRGAAEIRAALQGVTREVRGVKAEAKDTGGPLSALGLNTSQGFLRAGLAIAGVSAGLNVAAGLASSLHDQLARGIQGAIDLAETMNKVEVVFGSSADRVKAIGKDAPAALGTTANAALASAASFGNLFTSLGLTKQQAAGMSTEMVRLAADLASFHNIKPELALEKLQSGLVGEIEPLRALGVTINETQTEAKALALGFVPVNGQLSEAAKVQARYALILEKTTTAQGDFARTAGSLANQQRIAAASADEVATAVGAKLTPTLQGATAASIDFAKNLKDVLPGAVEAAVAEARRELDPLLVGLRDTVDLLARIKRGGDRATVEGPKTQDLRAEAFKQVGLAVDAEGRAVDANTGTVLNQTEALDRWQRALDLVNSGLDQLRQGTADAGADIGFLEGKIGAPGISGAVLDEALRKAALATQEINAENRGPVTHPVEALQTELQRQLAILEDQRSQAARANVDLAIAETQARLRLLPIQQELADLQREIAANQNKALQLTKEEAVLRAQQAANPANDALQDVQTAERRLQLIIATTKGSARAAARKELRDLIRSRAEQKAELAALDAGVPVTQAERAQRDTALTTQIANIPKLIEAAKLEINAQPLEAAVAKARAAVETDTAERAKVTAGLDKSINSLSDDIKILSGILSGKPTGLYIPGQDRNDPTKGGFAPAGAYPTASAAPGIYVPGQDRGAHGGFNATTVDANGNPVYAPQAPQAGSGYYRLEVVLNTDGIKQTVFNDILQGEGQARMPTAPVPANR